MAKFDIDFIWYRTPRVELVKRGTALRQKGELEPYSPFKMEKMPFIFQRLDGSPASCLAFAQNFGFLRTGPRPSGAEEEIADWRHAIGLVRSWIRVLGGDVRVIDSAGRVRAGGIAVPDGRTRSDIANVKVFIECEPGRSRRLTLRPVDLLNAMLLELAASSGIGTCEQCGHWFGIGGEGRRVIARFCSDECRNRHNYEKRRAGK